MRPVSKAITTPIRPTAATAIASVCAARTTNVSDIPRNAVTIRTATHAQKAAEARIRRPWGHFASIEQSVVDPACGLVVFVTATPGGGCPHGHRNLNLPDRGRRDPLLRRQRRRLRTRDLHGRPDPDDLRRTRAPDLAVLPRLDAPRGDGAHRGARPRPVLGRVLRRVLGSRGAGPRCLRQLAPLGDLAPA